MSARSIDEWATMVRRVSDARGERFSNLVEAAGLNPSEELRRGVFSGVSFAGCQLRGYDFSGATLIDCDFAGASIVGARFDGATFDTVAKERTRIAAARSDGRPYAAPKHLRAARDWDAYRDGWTRTPVASTPSHNPAPGAVFQHCPWGPELVMLPPGTFVMGSPEDEAGRYENETQHSIRIDHPFAVGRFAVTFEDWDFAMSKWLKRKAYDEGWGRGRRPVINVSWRDAKRYVAELSRLAGQTYRLLTEVEWEYACRAGTSDAFSCGHSISTEHANFNGASVRRGTFRGRTLPVDEPSFSPNPFGIWQMHGNVFEWCTDADEGEDYGPGGITRTSKDARRILRGGSWFTEPRNVRSANRYRERPDGRFHDVGFRLAWTP